LEQIIMLTSSDWKSLDSALRGTGVDPQQFANSTGLTIVCDEDAAMTGECWFGVNASRPEAIASYEASEGTVSDIWVPVRAVEVAA
jgi:hypothetical protein